ncbi:MAG: phytanoyl-CoA dioxygenase family protein [Bacteroidia bacterium]
MASIVARIQDKINRKFFRKRMLQKQFDEGFAAFRKNGATSQESYLAMINLYCMSNGRFNEELHKKLAAEHPKEKDGAGEESMIGKLSAEDYSGINETLNKDGYVNFERKIPAGLVKRLYDYALETPALAAPKYDKKIVYDPANPVSEIYRFDLVDLVNNPDIQALIMDPGLINVARNYLGSEPVFDFPAMWWSTCFLKEASSEAAQLYHFDMDRVKWLKIFIYLNDVTMENGPHSYIRGSHAVGAKPAHLLKRGYARISDEELAPHYKKDDFITICAEAGSVFAGDTKCWHKGNPLKKGHRLALEFEYTTCMFGSAYPKFVIRNCTPEFKEFCGQNKHYASNLHFS